MRAGIHCKYTDASSRTYRLTVNLQADKREGGKLSKQPHKLKVQMNVEKAKQIATQTDEDVSGLQ